MAMEKNLGPFRIRPRGEYNDTESYRFLDLVSYNGGSYLCSRYDTIDETTCMGISPEDTDYWMCIAEKGDTGSYEMEYLPIKTLTGNDTGKYIEYIWDYNNPLSPNNTDKIRIDGDDKVDIDEKLIIKNDNNNLYDGCCGSIITRKSKSILPENSKFSIDFDYITIKNSNEYYLYTFIYMDDDFIWNRSVIVL